MSWLIENGPAIETERHFEDRLVKCFADRPKNLDQLLRDAVRRNGGGGDAIVDGDIRISYEALDDIVDRITANLEALGVAKGDRIALLLGNSAEFIYLILAAARISAITVPINVREQTPEIAYILDHSGAKILVHDESLSSRLPDLGKIKHRFAVGGGTDGGVAGSFEELLGERPAPSSAQADEEDVAVILYTSGTTGRPKGAMLTTFNIVHSVMHYELCMDLTAAERSVLAVPASHVTGLIANILAMIRVGGCSLILRQFETTAFLDLATRENMTHTLMVPAMYNLCLLRANVEDYDLSSWRIGGYGGAPMPEATIKALAERLPNLGLINAYGATEVTSPATMMPPGETARRPGSIGIPVPCADIRIVGPKGQDAGYDQAGEIWIAGPMVVPGYWNDSAKTAAGFERGYWKSGDIGSMAANGFVRILDRIKDVINRGGYNVYSAELENTLSHHPCVIECAAVAHPDEVLGEKIHLFVRTKTDDLAAEALRQFCAEHLADYKLPDFVTFLNEPLPRNANGKVLKAKLRALLVVQ